jgi:hypothetical protein
MTLARPQEASDLRRARWGPRPMREGKGVS